MSVAMAACSLGLHLSPDNNNNCFKLLEKSISSVSIFKTTSMYDTIKPSFILHKTRLSSSGFTIIPRATAISNVEDGNQGVADTVPTPIVIIDQDSDPDATVVEITFGDRLGALLDTMNALKNLGLNVVKANVYLDSSGKHNKFSITKADTGRKVDDPELLEAIRLTILNNMITYHPESSAQLALGAAFGLLPPKEQVDVDIATHLTISDDGIDRSLLYVETADRPGLLVDLVKSITDINIAVESGEFDTEGLLAKAKFHVNYKGKAIIKPLQQLLGFGRKNEYGRSLSGICSDFTFSRRAFAAEEEEEEEEISQRPFPRGHLCLQPPHRLPCRHPTNCSCSHSGNLFSPFCQCPSS